MTRISRRTALGIVAAGVGVAASGIALEGLESARPTVQAASPPVEPLPGENPIMTENRAEGSASWATGSDGTKAASDQHLQISAYASDTSVNRGERITFHVTVATRGEKYSIAIYRLGYYSGKRARHLVTSPTLQGIPQAPPAIEPDSRMVSCDWPASWALDVPSTWTSGYHLAVLTTASGRRSFVPFVVRDDARSASILVVAPFATYQAYNLWPRAEGVGRSLYYGFDVAASAKTPPLVYAKRAFKVTFSRPYGHDGLPNWANLEHDFISWAEHLGFDLTYASNIDLQTGRVDLTKYAGVVFSGHDEYWSATMRDALANAIAHGTSAAFLSANNVYWHVRFALPSTAQDPAFYCYKTDPDPNPDATGSTAKWRDPAPAPAAPEQSLLGAQFNGIVMGYAPLVVQASDHWFWAGTGARAGDRIDKVIFGEADGISDTVPHPAGPQTVLAASPYLANSGDERVQNTTIHETDSGGVVFVAGSLTWSRSLSDPAYVDARIQGATANLLRRIARAR